ncbi:DNA-binding transcriptional regulator, AcrR family [Rhodococcus tukisamuensis]|uniref:DNA-binding transcriptional regulator, AcrR family n=2 Tax=Rhodococcus tukisamuensis TaxID=168276 RepID=A0A1G6XJK4_9NOCA|nr:DNA-binding transcriptional regulator, AcrR family [Rhodococcus tukisamuensis]
MFPGGYDRGVQNTPIPMADGPDAERCDAVRNRALLLEAATALVSERGADAVTMDAVAERAGVGKGTVFRRFGSRSGLMQSLLDHSEHELQGAFLTGPPPLGPGADAVARLIAFGRARLAIVELQGDTLRAVEVSPELRFGGPARQVSLTHVVALLRQTGAAGDLELLAQALLATLEAGLVLYQIRELHMPVDRIADGWETLVRLVTGTPSAG